MPAMTVGDGGDMLEGGQSSYRGYLSFDISGLPTNLAIKPAELRVFQQFVSENGSLGVYPIWNVPGGNTLRCKLDHVLYGDTLDTLNWTAGDPSDAKMLEPGVQTFPKDVISNYRILDVTGPQGEDVGMGRIKAQFQIVFPIDQPNDGRNDLIVFDVAEVRR